MFRIGQSSDIHRLQEGRKLILGGVEIAHEKGLLGHSDADALTHAIAESILGALALGDLGTHFPDTDERWRGVSSLFLLSQVCEMMEAEGYAIGNLDALIMIDRPKMAPHIMKMRENIAHCLHCCRRRNETMRVLIQRVRYASCKVDGEYTGKIDQGFRMFVGCRETDDDAVIAKMADKASGLRIFEDENGKMNRSLEDVGGAILSISQFTLYADCRKGRRPGFTEAARGDTAIKMYDQFNEELRQRGFHVETGIFGEDMKIELLNDGPVTIWLDSDAIM